MKFISGYLWEKGISQGENQDSVLLQQVRRGKETILLACVCDGMGGLDEGETASGYMTGRLMDWFYGHGMKLCASDAGDDRVEKSLVKELRCVREELCEYGTHKGLSLGTAVTGILAAGSRYWMIHCGDSRAYLLNSRFHRPHIRRLTCGHSPDGFGAHHGGKSFGISRAVGSMPWKEPLTLQGRMQRGIGILLCTDGFYRGISEALLTECLDVREIREERQISKRLGELMQAGRRRGEKDDGSAVYIKTM